MIRQFLLGIGFIATLALLGCGSGYHWSKSHPDYAQPPYGALTVTGTNEAFVLMRSNWFAKKMNIGQDSIQLKATAFCERVFLRELARAYPDLKRLPDSSINRFPEESQKLDDRIFMKGRLPDQGVSLTDSAGNLPPIILILHEFIIGTDLKREEYFDYALIHNESSSRKTSKNLSAVVSYTLWDNLKQRPLFAAVDEVQQPMILPSFDGLDNLVTTAVQQIRKNLYAGAGK